MMKALCPIANFGSVWIVRSVGLDGFGLDLCGTITLWCFEAISLRVVHCWPGSGTYWRAGWC